MLGAMTACEFLNAEVKEIPTTFLYLFSVVEFSKNREKLSSFLIKLTLSGIKLYRFWLIAGLRSYPKIIKLITISPITANENIHNFVIFTIQIKIINKKRIFIKGL
jgi:hypothetical protein